MENIRESEKVIIIILGTIMVIAGFTLIMRDKSESDVYKYQHLVSNAVEPLTDNNRFLSISSSINKYIDNIKYKDIDGVMSILDKKYAKDNKIDSSNVLTKINKYNDGNIADVREAYQVKKYDHIYVYYVRAKLIEETFNSYRYVKDEYYKITLNENELTFAVAPLNKSEYLDKVGDKNEK